MNVVATRKHKWFFTFNEKHVHPKSGESMNGFWVEIDDATFTEARELMKAKYGNNWIFQFTEYYFNPKLYPKGMYEKILKQ